jgi:hypothetical protein
MRKEYENILLKEHENGAVAVMTLDGRNITVVDTTINGYKKQLDRLNYYQGKLIRQNRV